MYTRNCPNCDCIITYKFKSGWYKATKNNSICKKCSAKNTQKPAYDIKTKNINGVLFYVRNCPSCKTELRGTNYRKHWDAIKFNKKCKSCTVKNRYNLNALPHCENENGNRVFYRNCPSCSKKIYYKHNASVTSANKYNRMCSRCSRINAKRSFTSINKKYVFPNYNPIACKLIDEYGKLYGYNFRHALNGGEFPVPNTRYYVDGYDEEKNVVIEVDEAYHKRQTEKDIKRQQEIVKQLNCKFIRVWFDEYKHNFTTTGVTGSVFSPE